ncbi:MAG: heavy metal transporter [Flavobacteriaceae bacterium]|nr:MAG: heavy metal transporter [Flavobacteriaceae bacterium]
MKKVILALVIFATVGITSAMAQEKVTMATFGVRGNCGMCKGTIEKAAKAVDGVTNAIWDKTAKKMEVSFDAKKTSAMAIQKAVAASGYDTEKMTAPEKAYDGLHGCCQYDKDQKMTTSEKKMEDAHKGHNH